MTNTPRVSPPPSRILLSLSPPPPALPSDQRWLTPNSLKNLAKRLITVLTDILCDNTAVWSYEWNYEEKCADSFTVYYDQGGKPKKTSCFFSSSSTFMFSLSWYRRSYRWCSRSIWKVDCINTYGSYNRTCKGDYVRPFQPCKDVNANLTKTNISPLTAQVSRDTQETVVKRNFMLTYI